MSRDIELALEYLARARAKHQQQSYQLARDTRDDHDYHQIAHEAKLAAAIKTIEADLKLLDDNAAEFIRRFLT